jgi:polynucleotide 5'-hydroxyl-kinase GRC3/NOL9
VIDQAHPQDWQQALDAALAGPGVVFLMGATDTGKTTLALQIANAALARSRRVGFIDADVGQSEVGPPGAIGLALPSEPAESFAEWRPAAIAFVGATSPFGRLLDVVVGVRRLADEARRRGAETVVVDTSGLISGPVAIKLKMAKLEVLQPAVILALRRGRELDSLLRVVPAACRATVFPLLPAAAAVVKPPALRRARRAARFVQYLKEARMHEIDPRRVIPTDGWLFTGRTLDPPLLRAAANTFRTEVVYGEQTTDCIRLVSRGAPAQPSATVVQELFGTRRVLVSQPTVFHNLLVGLLEEGGRLAEIGLIQNVDFAARIFRVLSPLRAEGALRALRYGRLRLRPDGTEIGPVRPGDL